MKSMDTFGLCLQFLLNMGSILKKFVSLNEQAKIQNIFFGRETAALTYFLSDRKMKNINCLPREILINEFQLVHEAFDGLTLQCTFVCKKWQQLARPFAYSPLEYYDLGQLKKEMPFNIVVYHNLGTVFLVETINKRLRLSHANL
jgi:hypothetical protein